MKVYLLPKTKLGKWSFGLIVTMPILLSIGMSFANSLYKSVPSGNTVLEDIVKRPTLPLTMLTGMAAGISAFVLGLTAIIRKERAILVYAATLIGLLLMFFLVGEILFPH